MRKYIERGISETYANHTTAALASAFLVRSQLSSKPIGNMVIEQTPVTAMMTKSPAVLSGLTMRKERLSQARLLEKEYPPAQMRDNHAAARIGMRIFDVIARW